VLHLKKTERFTYLKSLIWKITLKKPKIRSMMQNCLLKVVMLLKDCHYTGSCFIIIYVELLQVCYCIIAGNGWQPNRCYLLGGLSAGT